MMKYLSLFLAMLCIASAYNYHGCALAPDNLHGWVVTIDTALIFYTSNGGATWQQQIIPEGSKKIFDVTCIDEFSAWTCGILGEILHTDNGGLDWTAQIVGLSKYATRIEFLDQDYGWAACGDGVVGRTVDGGSWWEQVFTPWYWAEYYGVSFVNQWDGWIVAGWPDTLETGQGFILSSTDGGINWDSLYRNTNYEDYLDVYFFNLLDGIVVGGDDQTASPTILKTTDSGLNWNSISTPDSAYYLRAVDFIDNEGWAVGKHGTIIYTSNYGDTWEFQTNPADTTLFDVDFSDNLHGLACGYDGILYTTDGGQNWSITSGIQEENRSSSPQISYLNIFPNPFSEKTEITYSVGRSVPSQGDENPRLSDGTESIALKIYDVTGRLVKSFRHTPDALRSTQITWDGTDDNGNKVPDGIYIIHLETENYKDFKKIVFLK
jgi:photosystem II stability/assembly factor-like uncharacterized protein